MGRFPQPSWNISAVPKSRKVAEESDEDHEGERENGEKDVAQTGVHGCDITPHLGELPRSMEPTSYAHLQLPVPAKYAEPRRSSPAMRCVAALSCLLRLSCRAAELPTCGRRVVTRLNVCTRACCFPRSASEHNVTLPDIVCLSTAAAERQLPHVPVYEIGPSLPQTMATTDGAAAAPARLFDNLSFYLTNLCPSRQHFKELLEVNGGKICRTDKGADIIISDHLKSKGADERAISHKWIDACVKERELQDTQPFLVSVLAGRTAGASKKTGRRNTASSIKQQVTAAGPPAVRTGPPNEAVVLLVLINILDRGRVEFTAEDDAILVWWLEHELHRSGNRTYKELAAYALSNQARYRDGPKPPPDFDITGVRGWHQGISRPGDQQMNPSAGSAAVQGSSPLGRSPPRRSPLRSFPLLPPVDIESPLDENINFDHEFLNPYDLDLLSKFVADEGSETITRLAIEARDNFSSSASETDKYLRLLNSQAWAEVRSTKFKEHKVIRGDLLTEREKQALISKAMYIEWASTREEQLDICQTIADEVRSWVWAERPNFKGPSTDDYLETFRRRIKPFMKQVFNERKLQGRELELVVLRGLREDRRMILEYPHRFLDQNTEPDTDYRDIDLSNPATRLTMYILAAERKPFKLRAPLIIPTPEPRLSPDSVKAEAPVASTPSGGQAAACPPEIPRDSPSKQSPLPQTPATVKPAQNPPLNESIQQGSPTPRPRATQLIDLTSDAEEESASGVSPELDIKIEKQSSPTNIPVGLVPASSPPPLYRSDRFPPLEQPVTSPRRLPPLGATIEFSSSVQDESEDIPYRQPTKTMPSSIHKIARASSSRSTSKRRKSGGMSYSDMFVEDTPQKLVPLPDTSSNPGSTPRSTAGSFNQRPQSPTLSPLAHLSRKRKASGKHSPRSPSFLDDDGDYHIAEETEDEENASADTEDEEEAMMEAGGLPNRDLGLLNDNSPGLHARRSATPLPEADETLNDVPDGGPPQGSQAGGWVAEYVPWTEAQMKEFYVGRQDMGNILHRTCCDKDLALVILQSLRLHCQKGGTEAGFEWPERRGIWTEVDDEALSADADEAELQRVVEKHGKKNLDKRWDWLEKMARLTHERDAKSTQNGAE
ncbi:hypothetical protein Dda_9003 [Drechslerella dactyloides]|uniref:BRCT domain-containing protein n=1 Tax=Drechslerella dactyloides TaxID=74499 RepID=A0AAD6IPY7_DREDA|nr:hypothetical protein Dda_9003 [Drechslerella dactyloides]